MRIIGLYFCVFCLLFAACDSSKSKSAALELEKLQAEVENLKNLRDHVDALEQEVSALKTKVGGVSSNEAAITAVTYHPSSSFIDDPFLGPKDAELLMMGFSEYQCAPCRRFYWDVFSNIKSEFIETGKIKFVFRDFPLKSNKHARAAAQLANCAGEQGYYWQMFDILFSNPEEVDTGNFYDLGKKLEQAKQEDLHQCMEKTAYSKEIDGDVEDGSKLGVRGAPAFFIGKKNADDSFSGVLVRGAQPFGVIEHEVVKLIGGE